jgi:catechol 2,3-dioxygenase-like lactoylglutathione lyase family enzyme
MSPVSRLHHVGIPVASIERSQPWYEEVLGIIVNGLTSDGSGEVISEILEVQDADVHAVFLSVGDHAMVELLEYRSPTPKPFAARNCDVGVLHACFETDDVHAVHEALLAKGAHVNGPPMEITEGPLAGWWFCYFRDPDGIQLELLQQPKRPVSA